MEFKKYTVCPTLTDAEVNIHEIEKLMRKDGLIDDSNTIHYARPKMVGNKVIYESERPVTSRYYYINPDPKYCINTQAFTQTDEDPGNEVFYNYKIYNFLNDTAKNKFKDFSAPPHSLDYIIDVKPRFHAIRNFNAGLVQVVRWYEWDYENPNPAERAIQEILKVEIKWTLADDSPFKATKSVLRRKTTRWWMTTNNEYIPGTEKVTYKEYDSIIDKREEGRRRRQNIITLAGQDYTILSMILMNRTEAEALMLTEQFFAKIVTSVNQYIEGSNLLISELVEGTLLNDLLEDAAVVLDTVVPDLPITRFYTPKAIGVTVKDYIIERVKGNL